MGRRAEAVRQLELSWAARMQWSEVPETNRKQIVDLLTQLLRGAAGEAKRVCVEVDDEQ
jgi:hypothetical protein